MVPKDDGDLVRDAIAIERERGKERERMSLGGVDKLIVNSGKENTRRNTSSLP